jgi:hypothetical protein
MHLRGVPLAVIAKWLGHADASITARLYAHSQDDALRAAGAEFGRSCDILVTLRTLEAGGGSEPDSCRRRSDIVSVVPPAGFEPAAFCSGGRRSIP